jgi:uncharacterized protein (TIGR02266 family)
MTTFESDASADFQRSTRMPLEAVVRLHFEGTVAYQNGFAANVSASGMFVKHPEPPPLGTRLVFEFAIGLKRKPAQGAGEVVWVREKYEGPGRPAGAGIRFAELDELSRQNIAEALFEFLEASLGDRVADNPEARALVASRPTRASPADMAPEAVAEPEPEPVFVGAATRELPALPALEARDGANGATPFRIFDEEPAPLTMQPLPPEAPAPPAAIATPAVPIAWAGAAAAREEESGSRRWLALAAAAAVLAAAGFAAWWLLWRAPADANPPSAPAPAVSAPASAPRPAPPPLGARLGPGRTLADSVAPTPSAPGTPLPAGAVPPEDAETVAAARAETGDAGATAAPEPAAARAPAAPRATAVREIAAAASSAGTVVTLTGDGELPVGAFTWSEIGGDKPRVLIKLKGMSQPFRGSARAVPTPEVQGVRTGYHQQAGGAEVHVVIDLVPGARVEVVGVEPAGDRILVTLRRR